MFVAQQLSATAGAHQTHRPRSGKPAAPSRRARASALPAPPLPELAGAAGWAPQVARNTLTLHQLLQHLGQTERLEASAGRSSGGAGAPRQPPISWVDPAACVPPPLLDSVLSESEEGSPAEDTPLAALPPGGLSATQRAALALAARQAAKHAKPAGLDADAALTLPGLADVAVVSRGGWQRASWKPCNQDAFLALPLAAAPPEDVRGAGGSQGACCPPALALGVFDGHGREGGAAATHLRNALASGLLAHNQLALLARQQSLQQEQPQEQPQEGRAAQQQRRRRRQRPPNAASAADDAAALLERCFAAAAATLPSSGADFSLSGSTAVLCLVQPGGVTAAWAGDSRAVVGLRRGRRFIACALTHDHRPCSPLERARIQASGGCVLQGHLDEDGQAAGPHRVYLKESSLPGLAVSRCFGDYVAATAGVTSTPDITSLLLPLPPPATHARQQQPRGQRGQRQHRSCHGSPPAAAAAEATNQHILIVASDGLWEFVGSAEAVRIASRCGTAAAAAERLVQEAQAQWASRFGGQLCDDVTVAVAFLPASPASPLEAAAAAEPRRRPRQRRGRGGGNAAAPS